MVKKAPYEKPQVVRMDLKAEEVLAVGCKGPGGPSNFGGLPACGPSRPCNQPGS